ncbi:MAG: ATP-binding protein [Solirubrobacterales bacterium]
MANRTRSRWIRSVILAAVLVSIVFFPFKLSAPAPTIARAKAGELDISGVSFQDASLISLQGQWTFYWKQLLSPAALQRGEGKPNGWMTLPDTWNDHIVNGKPLPGPGYATFRLLIQLPPGTDQELGLRVPPAYTAYKIWVNGKTASAGQVSSTARDIKPGYLVNTIYFWPKNNQVEIVLQVANTEHQRGGPWQRILFGTADQITNHHDREMLLESSLFGAFLIIGLYHLWLYYLRRKDIAPLYFGLFCILFGLRVLLLGEALFYQILPNLPWEVGIKTEFISYYLGVPLFTQFIYGLFQQDMPRRSVIATWTLTIPFVLLTLFGAARDYSGTLPYFQMLTTIPLVFVTISIGRAIWNRREGAATIGLGCLLFSMTIINDILYFQEKVAWGTISQYGFLFFVLIQSAVISTRYAKAYANIEEISEKLLTMDRLKDEFLNKTSDELRSPLNTVIDLAETTLKGASENLNATQKTNLSMIITTGGRLIDLVNNLLDYTRLRNSDLTLRIEPVDIRQIVDVVFLLYRPVAPHRIRLTNDVPYHLPLAAADESRLHQIFSTLINYLLRENAAGIISISAEAIESTIQIRIQHSGLDRFRDDVLQILHRDALADLDNGVRFDDQWAGLAFGIARGLIELHGGSIRTLEGLDTGIAFEVTLPASEVARQIAVSWTDVPEQSGQSEEPALDAISEAHARILIADDDPIMLRILTHQLTMEGYTVVSATNGFEILDRIEPLSEAPFDLVMIDASMPGISGYEVCTRIRTRHSLTELPVLILIASYSADNILAAFAAGANDFVSKPYDRQILLARVKMLLELRKATARESAGAKELEQLNLKMREFTGDLELKVRERTIALERSNLVLARMNDDLTRMEMSRSRLLSNISHDLRTPMTLIRGYLEAILDGVVTDSEQTEKYLQIIHNRIMDIIRITGELFELTQLESRLVTLNTQSVLVAELMRRVHATYLLDVEAAGGILKLELPSDIAAAGIRVDIDLNKMDRVFANLIFNALKYSEPRGQITLGCSVGRTQFAYPWPGMESAASIDRLSADFEPPRHEVVIRVQDTGMGILPEDIPHIFERFYMGSRARSTGGGSSGLGLAVAKEIIEYHRGRIWVESTPEVGSTFYIALPLAGPVSAS